MFQDPNMPDFDSMSQEELIEWLETLAHRQGDYDAVPAHDFEATRDEMNPDLVPELLNDHEWSAWIEADDDLQRPAPPVAVPRIEAAQNLEDDDDETPTALPVIEEAGSDDTTDPLTELDDIIAHDQHAAAPIRAAAEESASPEDLESEGELEDPLEWLESLASEVSDAAAELETVSEVSDLLDDLDDIDDAYEDDERLDDIEDESIYSRQVGETMSFLESLTGFGEEDDEYSTQSMAPLPDELIPAVDESEFANEPLDEEVAVSASNLMPASRDNLMQAFMLQDHQADLEAWYEARLREVASGSDTSIQAPAAPAAKPAIDLSTLPAPPPGLAAGFNSARGKIAASRLQESLADYETLLRANIGLDLVAGDMRWLLEQSLYRDNPSVHRVLGDALMRQGHLQQALDVYRHALKLL